MSFISRANQKRKNVFYGWWVVAAGLPINALGVGFFFYGWSNFFKPLVDEFGWSRTLIGGVSSLSRLEGGIEGPFVGVLIDRVGARLMTVIGAVITGLGFMALYLVNSPWQLYLIFGILSFGYNMGFTHGTVAAVAKWFIKRRSRALAFLIASNGVGGAIFVPVAAWLIIQYGWRMAVVIIGVVMLAVVVPLAALGLRSKPEDMGLLPDGPRAGQDGGPVQEDEPAETVQPAGEADLDEINFPWREAMKTQPFWVYAISMLFR